MGAWGGDTSRECRYTDCRGGLPCGKVRLVEARQTGRRGHRRSSEPQGVTFATLCRQPDGTFQGRVSEQLAFALDVDLPGPQLVVMVPQAPTGDDMTGLESQTMARPLAEFGQVLAQVLEFHEAFDLPREPLPTAHVGDVLAQLRVRLLREEVEEFADATERLDIVAIADALADIVYVAYGSAITYGIELDAVVREVHRANMSKLDQAGRPVLREDGKVLKSQQYRPPDVTAVLEGQLELFDPDKVATSASIAG